MNKGLRTALICMGGAAALALIAVCTAVAVLSSSGRVTGTVNRYAEKYLPEGSGIGRCELTFLRTFPHISLQVDDITVLSPMPGAPTDTLAGIQRLSAGIELMEFLRNGRIISDRITLSGARICLLTDSLGRNNFFMTPSQKDTLKEPVSLGEIALERISLEDVTVSFANISSGMYAEAAHLDAQIKGGADKEGVIDLRSLSLKLKDAVLSSDGTQIHAADARIDASGRIKDMDSVDARMRLSLAELSAQRNDTCWISGMPVSLDLPIRASLAGGTYSLGEETTLTAGPLSLSAAGDITLLQDSVMTDLRVGLNSVDIEAAMAAVPDFMLAPVSGLKARGNVSLNATVKGAVSQSVLPKIDGEFAIQDGEVDYKDVIPLPLSKISANGSFDTDLKELCDIVIGSLSVSTAQSALNGRADVRNLLADPGCRVSVSADLDTEELCSILPDTIPLSASGIVHADASGSFLLSSLKEKHLDRIDAQATLSFPSLEAMYDTVSLRMADADVTLSLPASEVYPFAKASLHGNAVTVTVPGGAAAASDLSLNADLSDITAHSDSDRISANIGIGVLSVSSDTLRAEIRELAADATAVGNLSDSTKLPILSANVAAASLDAGICDTLRVTGTAIELKASSTSSDRSRPAFDVAMKDGTLSAEAGTMLLSAGKADISASVRHDPDGKSAMSKWHPTGNIKADGVSARIDAIPETIFVPRLDMAFTPQRLDIADASVSLGQTDLRLSGSVSDIDSYMDSDGLLEIALRLDSEVTDVNHIMDLVSGIGADEQEQDVEYAPDEIVVSGLTEAVSGSEKRTEGAESGPFLVPKGIAAQLDIDIANALIGTNVARNVAGRVIVDDGTLVLDNLSLESTAADIQLTAMYKSPRRDHLYLGLDYHMTDVAIDNLLATFPDIRDMMPMLQSFAGTAEFHMAVETNLDSLYNLKKSTLRGAASLVGHDLRLMDNETFDEISRKLMFQKSTENRIDSLSTEFTVFRNEIDVYPFLVVMDRYKAIVGGRHNLDMSMDYNISMIHNPIVPVRLGVDIAGKIGDLSFKVGRSRYDAQYRPTGRRELESAKINLRNVIYEALRSGMVSLGTEDTGPAQDPD